MKFSQKLKRVAGVLSLLMVFQVAFTQIVPAKSASAAGEQVTYKAISGDPTKVGSIIEFAVNVSGVKNVYGASVDFKYDPSILEVQSINKGTAYGSTAVQIPVKEIKNGEARLGLTMTGSTSNGVTLNGTLAVIKAKVLKAGKVNVNFTSSDADLSLSGNTTRVKFSTADSGKISYTSANTSFGGDNPPPVNTSKLVSFTADKSIVLTGQSVTFTATATPAANTLYQFYIYENGKWVLKQAFSNKNSFTYSNAKAGKYQARVFVKHTTASASQDSMTLQFNITTTGDTTSKVSSITANNKVGRVGTPTKFTANATPAADTLYEFYANESGKWERIQAFSNNKTITYTPKKVGAFKVRVFVKHVNSSNKSDGYVDLTYTVVNASDSISTINSFAANNSSVNVGSKITFTATATPAADTLYEFYVYENNKWVRKQLFSSNNTFSYTPTKAGSYQARVFVKHKNADKASDQQTITFTVK